MALEYQRYGRNKDAVVNRSYIESGEYRNKFNNITDNIKVNRILYSKAKEMLYHRSGTLIEDMYWIDGDTGEIVTRVVDQTGDILERIEYPEYVRRILSKKTGLIAMHTHPCSMPPSVADFNSAFYNNYSIALVICHDGKIFRYFSNQEVSERTYAAYFQRYIKRGYSEYDAQTKAIEKLNENHDIGFWEVIE